MSFEAQTLVLQSFARPFWADCWQWLTKNHQNIQVLKSQVVKKNDPHDIAWCAWSILEPRILLSGWAWDQQFLGYKDLEVTTHHNPIYVWNLALFFRCWRATFHSEAASFIVLGLHAGNRSSPDQQCIFTHLFTLEVCIPGTTENVGKMEYTIILGFRIIHIPSGNKMWQVDMP